MLTMLWGDWMDGRLGRRPYAIAFLLSVAAVVAVVILVGLAAGGLQTFYGDWPDDFSEVEQRGIGTAAFLGFLLAMLAIGLAQLNLVVKRARDTGASGLVVGFLFILLLATGVSLLIALLLAFIPTGQFATATARGQADEP